MYLFFFEWSSSNANIGMDQGLFQDVQYHSNYHWTWGYSSAMLALPNGKLFWEPKLRSTWSQIYCSNMYCTNLIPVWFIPKERWARWSSKKSIPNPRPSTPLPPEWSRTHSMVLDLCVRPHQGVNEKKQLVICEKWLGGRCLISAM